jgi:hypothetical protein
MAIAGIAGRAVAGPLVEAFTCYGAGDADSLAMEMKGYMQCFDRSRQSYVASSTGSARDHVVMNRGLLNLANHNHLIGYGGECRLNNSFPLFTGQVPLTI